jgi:hypothetical protein
VVGPPDDGRATVIFGSRMEEPWRAYRLEDAFWRFGANAVEQR